METTGFMRAMEMVHDAAWTTPAEVAAAAARGQVEMMAWFEEAQVSAEERAWRQEAFDRLVDRVFEQTNTVPANWSVG